MRVSSIHADVLERTADAVVAKVEIGTKLLKYSKEDMVCEYSFKLTVSSAAGQVSLSGELYMLAEAEDELLELSKLVEESKKGGAPPQVIEAISLLATPLLTHIEKEMGLPITPLFLKHKQEIPLYQ